MQINSVKLTEEIAADIQARIKTLDLKGIEKVKKAKNENGTFDVIISTEDLDRSGEIVRQSGWELTNYKNNPIVLWGHDYYSLPIGICTDIYETEKNGVPATGAKGVFFPSEINPLAQQVRRMYDFGMKSGVGVGCTTSVGFIPKEFDENNRAVITKAELLEFSFVPIPANQGVGPAEGRALTFAEAHELKLDTHFLVKKGIEFTKDEPVAKTKDAEEGDSCTTDDGSAGTLASDPNDPDGPLVCIPSEDEKAAEADRDSQRKLTKDLADEHERHGAEVERALDEFKAAAQAHDGTNAEGTDDEKKAAQLKAAEAMTECFKDLQASLSDEQTMHRANSLKCFRSFKPTEDKGFDKSPHLKAVRDEHDAYEAKCEKAVGEFQKSEAPSDTEAIGDKLDKLQSSHKKALSKIAKAMCKAAYGEEEHADEKTLEILKEFLAPHISAQLLPAVSGKIASRITAAHREKLGEAHQNMKAALAIVASLHGALGDDEGDESRSVGETSPEPAPRKQRSRPAENAPKDDELDAHLLARDILRGVTTAAQEGLKTLKQAKK
ncbi:MAG TPA: hypothetical protein VKW08_00315 [Xanthobacteraceae bacterium]|nr:hypothetical protein [Xanthobacteraceae bacterium]